MEARLKEIAATMPAAGANVTTDDMYTRCDKLHRSVGRSFWSGTEHGKALYNAWTAMRPYTKYADGRQKKLPKTVTKSGLKAAISLFEKLGRVAQILNALEARLAAT